MRYPASEKLEIIRLVEHSHQGVRWTLDKLGIPKTTFYRWYERYLTFGEAALKDRNSNPGRVWNRIPDAVRQKIIDLALEETQLSPRELAVRFTDTRGYFVSEASVYHFAMTRKQHSDIFPWARRAALALIAVLTIAVLSIAGPNAAALAQSTAKVTGTMDATAEGEIAKGAAIRVRASSGAPEAQAIADLFRDALEDAGYRVGGNNELGKGYVLNFQFSGQSPRSSRRSHLELRGDSSSGRSGDVDLTMRWKATPDKASPPVRRGRQLSVAIEDAARNPLWQARINLHANKADDIALADMIMPALITNLGRTVYALRVP